LRPDERLNNDDWEKFTLNVASGALNRAETTERLRAIVEE